MAVAAVLHIGLSLIVPGEGWVTSLGCGGFLLIAALRCMEAAREDIARAWRWRLLATTFLLWLGAYISIAWTQSVLHADSSFALLDSLLFMARGAPLFLLLTYDASTSSRLLRRLDAAKGVLFIIIAAFLLFPGIAASDGSAALAVRSRTGFSYRECMNFGLSIIALIAWHIQTDLREQRLIGRVALLWLGYSITAAICNRIADIIPVQPGSPLWWPQNIVVALFVLATLRDRARPVRGSFVDLRHIGPEAVRRFAPGILTAGMLVMSMLIAWRSPLAGLILGLLAIGLYGVRSMMLQVRYVRTLDEMENSHETMSRLATRDHLTDLANRREFDAALDDAWDTLQEKGVPFGVLMIDIDSFRSFNDQMGNPAGDTCLQRCARVLQTQLGPNDILARYGGAEFAALTWTATLQETLALAERLRKAVADEAIEHLVAPHRTVTISVGAAVAIAAPGDSTVSALLKRTNDALARAKARGRNRVESASWPIAAYS